MDKPSASEAKIWVSFYGHLALPFRQHGGVCTRLGFLSHIEPSAIVPLDTACSHVPYPTFQGMQHMHPAWSYKKLSGGLQHSPHNFKTQSSGVWGKSKHKRDNKCIFSAHECQGCSRPSTMQCRYSLDTLMWVALSRTDTTLYCMAKGWRGLSGVDNFTVQPQPSSAKGPFLSLYLAHSTDSLVWALGWSLGTLLSSCSTVVCLPNLWELLLRLCPQQQWPSSIWDLEVKHHVTFI